MGQRGRKSAREIEMQTAIDRRTPTPSHLSVVVTAPYDLGEHGQAAWDRICHDYDIADASHIEQLAAACASLDRASRCRAIIDSEGDMIEGPNGRKDHPLIRHELAARSFAAKTFERLLDRRPK